MWRLNVANCHLDSVAIEDLRCSPRGIDYVI